MAPSRTAQGLSHPSNQRTHVTISKEKEDENDVGSLGVLRSART
jgi:hypothetical protein